MDIETLEAELKQLIVDECDVDVGAEEIDSQEILIAHICHNHKK